MAFINIKKVSSVGDILDVSTSGVTSGEVLAWDSSAQLWQPSGVTGGAGTLGALTDVSTLGAANGNVLRYNGSSWEPGTASSTPAVYDIVTVSGSVTGTVGKTYLTDSTSSAFTVYLPSGSSVNDYVKVKDYTGSSLINNVTVSGIGATIDGGLSYSMQSQYESVTFLSNGTNWFLV